VRRRDFLATGVVGAAGLTHGEAQAEAPLSDAALERDLKTLRRELRRIDRLDLPGLDHGRRSLGERGESMTQLMRSAMKTLLISSAVGQLPAPSREDARVDKLVRSHTAEMDFATLGMLDHLENLPEDHVRYVQDAIREDPEVLDTASEMLGDVAVRGGVHREAREHLDSMLRHVTWRLRRQPTSMIIEESTKKTHSWLETLAAQGSETGIEAPLEDQQKWGEYALSATPEGQRTSLMEWLPERSDRSGQAMMRRAAFRLATSGVLLVVGVGFGALAIVLLDGPAPDLGIVVTAISLVTLTGAAVMLIIGLVTLIVAAVRLASEAPPQELPTE